MNSLRLTEQVPASCPGQAIRRKLAEDGQAVAYRALDGRCGPGGIVLLVTTYADVERQKPVARNTWRFRRQAGGWVITEVV